MTKKRYNPGNNQQVNQHREAAQDRSRRAANRAGERQRSGKDGASSSPPNANPYKLDERGDETARALRGESSEAQMSADIMAAMDMESDDMAKFSTEELAKVVLCIIKAAVPAIVAAVQKHLDLDLDRTQHHRSQLLSRYRVDALEQYTRTENIRIFQLAEEEEGVECEDLLAEKVCKMAAAAGSKLEERDISTAHRLGGAYNPAKIRPVIVRFVSRRKKKDLMLKKRELKQSNDYKKAFICDDLTRMRHTVYRLAKEKQDYTFTKDGLVISKVKDKYVSCAPLRTSSMSDTTRVRWTS